MPNIIVGTAGHIDHGKTALVKALTGIDADRLKEEKERGITIDIGFANLPIDDETTLGFIDVPGHERFVKNMLAGVGGIDIVMLVVAADESVMPQTREHLDICSLLQIKRGLTVLTKIDATDPDLVDLAEIEVHEFLKGSFLEAAPIVRVSAATGQGIAALTSVLAELARTTPTRDATQIFRLPIDRGFTMRGFGTVVSGTLIAGSIHRDQEVELLPPQRSARVRGIQVHGAAVEEARAGQRTALNLQRVELGDIERGMVVVPPGIFTAARAFDVDLTLLPSAPGPIVRRKRIRFHVGTTEVMGYVVLLGRDTLEPGESAYAQILLEAPAFALPGDRFIVRQYSPMLTIGGGAILDAGARAPPPIGSVGRRAPRPPQARDDWRARARTRPRGPPPRRGPGRAGRAARPARRRRAGDAAGARRRRHGRDRQRQPVDRRHRRRICGRDLSARRRSGAIPHRQPAGAGHRPRRPEGSGPA